LKKQIIPDNIPRAFNYYLDVEPLPLPKNVITSAKNCIVFVKTWCPPRRLEVRLTRNPFIKNQWNRFYFTVYFKEGRNKIPRPFVNCGGRTYKEALNKFFDVGRRYIVDSLLDELQTARASTHRASLLKKFIKSLPNYDEK